MITTSKVLSLKGKFSESPTLKVRLSLLYTYESDLGDGWEDEEVHNNSPSTRLEALKMGSNILEFVFGN